jgi:hypothetical protein
VSPLNALSLSPWSTFLPAGRVCGQVCSRQNSLSGHTRPRGRDGRRVAAGVGPVDNLRGEYDLDSARKVSGWPKIFKLAHTFR